jgi:AmiR/NasT family two-component response regulator
MVVADSDAHVSDSAPKRKPLPPERPSRILIADDEHLVASGLTSLLTQLGLQVVGVAADGQQAIDLARLHMPDLVVLDIRMPKVDGLAAAEVIFRQHEIPVVILSAFSDEQCIAGASHAGVFGYILKPVTLDQLRVNLAVAWGRFLDYSLKTTEIVGLKERLADRKVIEQAKWILVKRKGIAEPEAMRLLQRQARNNRRTLADVAKSIIENEELFAGSDEPD